MGSNNHPERSLWDRLWEKVAIPDSPDWQDACWLWHGALSQKRNGKRPAIQMAGRRSPVVIVSRLVCLIYHGEPPAIVDEDGEAVTWEAGHTCPMREHPYCCNPRHLRWMSRLENEQHKKTYKEA